MKNGFQLATETIAIRRSILCSNQNQKIVAGTKMIWTFNFLVGPGQALVRNSNNVRWQQRHWEEKQNKFGWMISYSFAWIWQTKPLCCVSLFYDFCYSNKGDAVIWPQNCYFYDYYYCLCAYGKCTALICLLTHNFMHSARAYVHTTCGRSSIYCLNK